jgi:hypothetical protein
MRMTDNHGDAAQKDELEQVPDETREHSSHGLEDRFESLDATATKKAYDELSGVLDGYAAIIIHTLGEMVPYLSEMQSLLSQRGAGRKKVLNDAGLPGWTEWAKSYAAKFDCTVRTVQKHIKLFRMPKGKGTGSRSGLLLRIDRRLIDAQRAANRVVDALKSDGDWKTPLAEYEKVALSPARLAVLAAALSQKTDWEAIVQQLFAKLEEYGDKLPLAVTTEMRAIRKLLVEQTPRQATDAQGAPAVGEKATRGYWVKEKKKTDTAGVHYAVARDRDKEPYGYYGTRQEAESVCESLNHSHVASIGDVA